MIPERIFVQGFLCYREAQEARFEGSSLWLLAGPNGSGKSALFDAVTYSLYGQHRAGKHNARGLINKASDEFIVAFDFRLDMRRYRARRTLTRQGRPTRQLFQWNEARPAEPWCPIADTHSEQGFSRWVSSNLALSYETFTASVLLLQGRADNLLQVGPAERHNLLSQIVGLERFQQLHQRAKRRLTQAQGATAKLSEQVRNIPKISGRQLEAAREAVETATQRQKESAARAQQLGGCLKQAEQWQQLTSRQLCLERQVNELSEPLKHEADLQASFDRWKLLSSHLDKLAMLAQLQSDLVDCQQAVETMEKEKCELGCRLADLEITADRSTSSLQKVEQEFRSASLLANDLANQHAIVAAAISPLEGLFRARRQERQAGESIQLHRRQLEEACTLRKRLIAERPSQERVDVATRRLNEAAERVARSEVIVQEVERRSRRLASVSGAALCRYCRQPLPETHIETERGKLRSELLKAQSVLRQAKQEFVVARADAPALQQRQTQVARDLHEIECSIRQLNADFRTLDDVQIEARRACLETMDDLPERYRSLCKSGELEDPTCTPFPTETDIQSLQSEQRRLISRMRETRERVIRLQQSMDQLHQRQRGDADQQRSRTRHMQRLAEQTAQYRGQLTHLRRATTTVWSSLSALLPAGPPAPTREQVQELRAEHGMLTASGIAARYDKLREARFNIQKLSDQLCEVKDQLERIPELARKSPAEADQLEDEARKLQSVVNHDVQAAVSKQARLEEASRQGKSLSRDLKRSDRLRYVWDRLVALLGRDGLMRYLVRHAEQAIVEYANGILDRLASGQLYLELRSSDARRDTNGKALDLLVRTATSDGHLQEVAFLSGSQKFRVAVSLSLAIGQYATRARRPVQAVIIDEGFGCLDTVNRQVMIQELHNLRGYLERVLIVSHQEEFAAAFPDGYRSEIADGRAKLTPFHR